ncbi:conserved hypothetical protein [Talaromyces stipitatus ATCC 10500]|uniref:ER membrane protein complex subunit 7 beta-sandwich domain-containing protein n=1 Tax=Talaromyces stipitatus (strain ATCC 10500 / CBS 375.48 / QM 6759 / NRRL 1006) TaxID=441959 RepID=B8MIM7_TALSN|nr:uncharacterized protein TSTA_045760 [Talaromyces stipitatus ATCC 10500]EED15119.1 conserved hypothetical protein [Talaromyces stipitatus ATCC 10500]
MKSPLLHLIALLSTGLILESAASSLTIQIPPNSILPNPHALPPNTHATLTTLPSSSAQDKKHILSAPITHTAEFHFTDLPSSSGTESYLLDIRSKEYIFAPYRVDIAADGTVLGIWETFRGNQWENRGLERYTKLKSHDGRQDVDAVVQAKVLARRGFYEERPKFSPLTLFKNPMILMSVFALVATFGIPKLLENMDPEMREEFEKQSRTGPLSSATRAAAAGANPGAGAGAPGFDIAGWMAGATSSPMSAAGSGSGAATGRESGAGARRR